jgi:hypothetical protein
MARIILGSYMVRYPLGGMLSWVLQFLVGFKRLGHEIYFVEKAGYPNSCYNPTNETMSDDCTYGVAVLDKLLASVGLENTWCFVDQSENYYGISKKNMEEIFRTSDIFIDMGTHGSWEREAVKSSLKVLIDGEPAFTQIKMINSLNSGINLPRYDHYFTTGKNIGTEYSISPTAGIEWKYLYHPVQVDMFPVMECPENAFYSTVMNWQSHQPIEYNGKKYGQKNLEFQKFIDLPMQVSVPMQVAVAGKKLPIDMLKKNGWDVVDAKQATSSFDAFCSYIQQSRGEFSVCKNVFVANQSGWFSDRSAAYLASGRPVVMQDTGFSRHLPCGEGLFAFHTLDEAKAAIQKIESDYELHSKTARQIACEYLDTRIVLKVFLKDLGI